MDRLVDIATVGYVFEEFIRYPDRESGPVLGGTVSYSSVCLARLGVRTGIVTNVGEYPSEDLLASFFEAGVNTLGMRQRPGTQPTRTILAYDQSGEKGITYLSRAPSIVFEDIPAEYHSARIFYFCPVDFEIDVDCVARVHGLGGRLAADLGGLGGAHCSHESWTAYAAEANSRLAGYVRYFDVVKASVEDCARLFPKSGTDPMSAADRLLAMGAKTAVITMGASGALIRSASETHAIPAFPCNAVDYTGAGDTFTAALLSQLLVSTNLESAGTFAAATSSLMIEGTGGVRLGRMPTRDAVTARIKLRPVLPSTESANHHG